MLVRYIQQLIWAVRKEVKVEAGGQAGWHSGGRQNKKGTSERHCGESTHGPWLWSGQRGGGYEILYPRAW